MTAAAPRYVCIHGHFYQPPRENPWLEAIEVEDSAAPYHDWNERITDECYAPNAAARLVNDRNEIVDIVNNFARMSFNVGPTLLSWLERKRPEVYAAILAADRDSQQRFAGHGSAIAQIYNHVIMPLATREEKQLQIHWGIADFRHRFQRDPEGMWLPETAVDLETLTLLAEAGIRFVVLSPFQAQRIRPVNGGDWSDVSGGRINPRQPYVCRLPPHHGRAIAVFFYDTPISRAVAFEGLLSRGEALVQRLRDAFIDDAAPQLVHIATDGESYGHHHRFGEMALAFTLHHIERLAAPIQLINYGAFLDRHPPAVEVELIERSSWSCAHGVERWRSDCGCRIGGFPSWRQPWRGPLREALNWLAAQMDRVYREYGDRLFKDAGAALRKYVEVLLQPSGEMRSQFLAAQQHRQLTAAERVRAWRLLEMMRHRQLMFTSCGWFFDDISGLETVQILKYAGRALQLSEMVTGTGLEAEFRERLTRATGNLPHLRDGGVVYDRLVKPLQTDLLRVVAHYGISSIVEEHPSDVRIYAYHVERRDYHRAQIGDVTLALGHVAVESPMTNDAGEMLFAVVYAGGQDFHCIVHPGADDAAYTKLKDALTGHGPLSKTKLIECLSPWGTRIYTLKDLFYEERRHVLSRVIQETVNQYETVYRDLYEQHKALLGSLAEVGLPLPVAFRSATHYVLQQRVELTAQRLREEPGALETVPQLREDAETVQVHLDMSALEAAVGDILVEELIQLQQQPTDVARLTRAAALVESACRAGLQPRLWTAQNLYFALYRRRPQSTPLPLWPEPVHSAIHRLGRGLQFTEEHTPEEALHGPRA